ncbi:MAG TPA: glycosyltransferase family 2 protein [Humisphaera sp.]|jgi:chlorobactene glucosyltransferase|nr:glycosyltransferase family 2 protein [Humisphaera sp.]
MILLLLSSAWLATVALLLIRAIRQYRHYQNANPIEQPVDNAPTISVIVPARNEQANIARCVEGLLSQQYPYDRMSIIVVDDNSEDSTAAIVSEISRRDSRVRLLRGAPPPPGWLGKPHACWAGAQAAGHVEWLCFCDADTAARPLLLNSAIQTARQRDLALLSLEPFVELRAFWERVVLPCGFFFIAFTQDVRRAEDPNDPNCHANGQFLLIRRQAYEAAGTFAAVRDQMAEDSAMARAIKRTGGKIAVLGATALISVRMFADFRSLWQSLSRQAGQLLGSGGRAMIFTMVALALAICSLALPIICGFAVAHDASAVYIVALVLSTLTSLALLGTQIGTATYFRIPFWYGFLFPLGYTVGAGILLRSVMALRSSGILWKGRSYPST